MSQWPGRPANQSGAWPGRPAEAPRARPQARRSGFGVVSDVLTLNMDPLAQAGGEALAGSGLPEPVRAYGRKVAERARTRRERGEAGVAGAANTATSGLLDEAIGFVAGDRAKARYRADETAARNRAPASFIGGQVAGGVLNPLSRVGMARGAVGIGGQVARAAMGGAAMGGAQAFGDGRGTIAERVPNAMTGAMVGGAVGAGVPIVGALGGRTVEAAGAVVNRATGGAAARVLRQPAPNAMTGLPAREIARVTRGDLGRNPVPAMRATRAEARRLGVTEPSVADLAGANTRALARAAAARQTPARQVVTQRADDVRAMLPERVSGASRRFVSNDPRAPQVAAAEIAERQRVEANANYGAVRNEQVRLAPETAVILRSEGARRAMREAAGLASLHGDVEAAAQLARLSTDALDNPGQITMSVGALDRLKQAFDGLAQAKAANPFEAGGYANVARSLFGDADASSPGYQTARRMFAADARRLDAIEAGDGILRGGATDEFVANAGNMTADERALAALAARRRIDAMTNETERGPLTVASRFQAQEPRQRLGALIGQDRADDFGAALRMERDALRTANFIDPESGSATATRMADTARLDGAGEMFQAMRGSPLAMISVAAKGLGMRDEEAALIAMALTDPAQADAVLDMIDRAYGPQAAATLEQIATRAAARASGQQAGSGVAY